ncbi:putative Acid phosphatase [Helianthus annuus]|nr:putative Acid phosphatase [Helianthus annuus]
MGSIVPWFPLIVFILFNFLDNIHAGVTSSFIRSEWPSDDMPLDNDAFAVPNGYNAPEQVNFEVV